MKFNTTGGEMRYIVHLERRLDGQACGTTRDECEADSAHEAEETLVAQWEDLDPRFTYAPLFTKQVS